MKSIAIILATAASALAVLPAQALEPWHDQLTARQVKQKAAKQLDMKRAAAAPDQGAAKGKAEPVKR